MTPEKKILKKESLLKLLDKIYNDGKVLYEPVKHKDDVIFARRKNNGNISGPVLDYIQTIKSAKEVVFPPVEKLFKYSNKSGETILEDITTEKNPETILFGVHPCDIASLKTLDAVFKTDFNDKFYSARREKTTIIGLACSNHDDYCFCSSVGLSSSGSEGSDIFLTPLNDGSYLAEIITEKGEQLFQLSKELFDDAPGNYEVVLTNVTQKFDNKKLEELLPSNFENDIWQEQAMRCQSCGTCAYVCPACSCYDMQDEGNMYSGSRLRCWDTCALSQFTIHTSGHNPRDEQGKRWRQRIMHKFSYQPERQNVSGCVGCGRCSRACPADMNILEHLIEIINPSRSLP